MPLWVRTFCLPISQCLLLLPIRFKPEYSHIGTPSSFILTRPDCFCLTIALWANQDKFLFSLVFYFYINAALFVFPLIMRVETIKDLIFRLTVASFGALLLITLVTLIIISEGDGFDLDLSGRGVIDVESPKKSKINEPNEH